MVAEIHRIEAAARMSMADFDGDYSSVRESSRVPLAVLACIVVMLAAAAFGVLALY
jgi:cytochrome c-type biogenesis protein CcmH/NrfG